ncbi:MAG: membrane dipeptidase [Bacteroidota bacterium]
MFSDTTNIRIKQLLKQAIVIDGHSDILIPITEEKLNIEHRVEIPSAKNWIAPAGLENNPLVKFGFDPHTIFYGCMGQYDIPRWKEGGINTQLCAIYLDDTKLDAPFKKGMEMAWYFHKTIRENEDLMLCTKVTDILKAKETGKIGWVLTFEGCEALGSDTRMIDLYYTLGVRAVSLTHTRRNIFAEGCWGAEKQGGITALGKSLVQRLCELGIVIDLVHIGEQSFWDILEITDKPFIVSHSTSTMFNSTLPEDQDLMNGRLPRPRLELPRDKAMLQAIADRHGVLGMIWILYRNLDAAVKDFETALEAMGSDHIGLGSDLYGHQLVTPGLEDISKLPNLLGALIERGHSEETLIKFLGGNYLRVFKEVWVE